MGNTFGQLFRVTTFGESHGGGIGVVIDGCPPNIDISDREIQCRVAVLRDRGAFRRGGAAAVIAAFFPNSRSQASCIVSGL